MLVAVSQKGTARQLAVPRGFCRIGKGWQGVAGWQMKEIVHFSYWLLPIYILCLLEYIVRLVGYRRGHRPQVVRLDRELLVPPSQVAEQTLFISRQSLRDHTPREFVP